VTGKFRNWARRAIFGEDFGEDVDRIDFVQIDIVNCLFLPSLIRRYRIRRVLMIISTPPCTANSDAKTDLKENGRAERRATRAGDRCVTIAAR